MVGLSSTLRFPVRFAIVVLRPRPGRNPTGLGCFPFARHYLGNHACSLFLRLLRCFSSAGSPSDIHRSIPTYVGMGCPIRKSADQRFYAAPRGLSQPCTSFLAAPCQGIHPVPLITLLIGLAQHPLTPALTSLLPTIINNNTGSYLPCYFAILSTEISNTSKNFLLLVVNPCRTNDRPSGPASPDSLGIAGDSSLRGATGIRTPDPLLAKQVL